MKWNVSEVGDGGCDVRAGEAGSWMACWVGAATAGSNRATIPIEPAKRMASIIRVGGLAVSSAAHFSSGFCAADETLGGLGGGDHPAYLRAAKRPIKTTRLVV